MNPGAVLLSLAAIPLQEGETLAIVLRPEEPIQLNLHAGSAVVSRLVSREEVLACRIPSLAWDHAMKTMRDAMRDVT